MLPTQRIDKYANYLNLIITCYKHVLKGHNVLPKYVSITINIINKYLKTEEMEEGRRMEGEDNIIEILRAPRRLVKLQCVT
jgi:hypothetical protein